MAKRTVRVRGILHTTDASPATQVSLVEEGTEDNIAVGANDILSIDSYQVSAGGTGAHLYFSSEGTAGANATIFRRVAAGISSRIFPSPMVGLPGKSVYAIAQDATTLSVVLTGTLYRA